MRKHKGFTLIELMIVVAIIAIIAAIAIPGLLRARIASNETAAIGTLRTLSTSEAQFQSAAIVDQDTDGTGEFGWLQEVAGTIPFRTGNGGTSTGPTSPAFITSVLGTTALGNNGYAGKSGYTFLMYLPTDAGPADAETAAAAGFPGVPIDANVQEVRFCCYAWPASIGNSGNRTFVVSQQGEVFATANKDFQGYDALNIVPPAEAAFYAVPPEDDTNLEGTFVSGTVAGDGQIWIPAGN